MRSPTVLSAIAAAALFAGCAGLQDVQYAKRGPFIVDAGGRPLRELEAGSSLHVGLSGLSPHTTYEIRLAVGSGAPGSRGDAISFARSTTDRRGNMAPVVLWYQSGVVGCSLRRERRDDQAYVFRSFEEAERALAGRVLRVSAHAVERDPSGRLPPMKLSAGAAEFAIELPVAKRRSPLVYASDAKGCLLNSQESGTADMYVSGSGFRPGEVVDVAVVPNQRSWRVGDAIIDMTGPGGAGMPKQVKVDNSGRFTVRAWERANQRRGAYDIVAHRAGVDERARIVRRDDVISYLAETGFILYLLYPIGGPTMDLAGRPLAGSPYFQFADSFAETNDAVWGAVDPTYVPAGHPGGSYAAYYVVDHKDLAGWTASTSLVDISGGIEIHPVKAGCVNGTDVIIWNAPLTVGQYDVVVDFGAVPATTPGSYATDGQYDETVDFLDGAIQVGFSVAKDPYELGPLPVGQDSYSADDFFPTLGSRSNVDLRAVVRYPATAAGAGTPVAPGAHPLFIMEHGNHSSCNTPGYDFDPAYDAVHTGCPSREQNHMGYMGLLERLASHGIIAVSIDAYDLTGNVPQLIPERSDLILKHLELWSHMNNTATFTSYPDFFAGRFAGHVDMSKLSVSGHSRGGEASVGAYMRNQALPVPFNIGSVSSIAPVDGQAYVLPDVPYLVILPAADGDVCHLNGQRIYDRAGSLLATPDGTTKSGIYVYGASHNFFNTVWAADGDDGAPGRDDYIPAADQQKLGEAYLAAFVRSHLKGETVYEDMLRGKLVFPSFAGRRIYPIRHEGLHSKLEAGSGAGMASGGATAVSVASPSVHQTQAVRVAWPSGTGQYTYTMAATDVSSFEVLSFRVAQTLSATNPAAGDQDFQVELASGGTTKATFASRFGAIPRPYNHVAWCTPPLQSVMTTIRVPLHSFIMNNSGVALGSIDTVRFKFTNPSQGEVYVDDIEFSR